MGHQEIIQPDSQETKHVKTPNIQDLEILGSIGSGGMASVFKARQANLDRIVAVKILSKSTLTDEKGRERFRREARVCASLNHPNIVKILSFGITEADEPYLVMEHLEGKVLTDEINNHAPLTFRRFQSLFIPLLSALQEAHKAGIVHRDVKPANIMICSEDGVETIKLLDFGIAKIFQDETAQNLTRTGAVVGSPSFMSPEQCKGESSIDGRSDIYSISCIM